jgi:hypothetical protein
MTTADDLSALQNRIAITTFDRLDEPWSRAAAVYVELGVTARLEYAVERAGTTTHAGMPTAAEFEAWEALRSRMAEPGRGAWFTARLLLDASGRYRFEFDRDQEPAWPVAVDVDGALLESRSVTGAELREDLRRYPRAEEPSWLRARIDADALVFADVEFHGALGGLIGSDNWGLVRVLTRDTVEAFADGGGTDDVDPAEVASSVLAEVLGVTQGIHVVRLLRDAEAAGLVGPVSAPAADLERPSYLLAGEDDAFRALAVLAVPVLEQVAAFELSNVVAR